MNLNQKIAFIQNAIGGLEKSGLNPHFKNRYVELNQIIDALAPLLTEQGLLLTMPLTTVYNRPALKLVIKQVVSSDENENDEDFIEETMPLPDLQDPQKMGSAITYYRRYMLMSFFNLKAEDDDGHVASHGKKSPELTAPRGDMAKVAKELEDEYNY